jgi:hypothetical protein
MHDAHTLSDRRRHYRGGGVPRAPALFSLACPPPPQALGGSDAMDAALGGAAAGAGGRFVLGLGGLSALAAALPVVAAHSHAALVATTAAVRARSNPSPNPSSSLIHSCGARQP